MKAIICTKYGSPEVLRLKEVKKPVPKKDEVCIKIYAAGVTASDIFIRSSNVPLSFKIPMRIMIGIRKPRRPILGLVLAGEIESVGTDIKQFKPGDSVYGLTGFRFGAYAEYACLKENDSKVGCLALKPQNISYEEATTAAYGGLLALQYFVDEGNIQKGDKVLIYGASGTSGTLAVQLAKHFGAEVTGVCSASNLDMVRNLGADHMIDYTKQDTLPEGAKYDLVLDSVGMLKMSKLKKACRNALTSKGKYLSIDKGALKLDSGRLIRIKEFVESGIIHPVMDKIYPFEDIVEAHRYVERGHKKGGVAITVNNFTQR
jgi:NADPH:quinone reductase-like Zn-dependent oxidoreductase